MKIFNFSKWRPLISFEYCGHSYIIMARINKRTGMLYFRQKKMNFFALPHRVPAIDTDEAFKNLLLEAEG